MMFLTQAGQLSHYHASEVDPFLSNVVLLVNGTGEQNSTIVLDSLGHTLTLNGQTKIDRTDSDFPDGGLLFDGSGDFINTSQSGSEFVFPGDFTIEFDYKPQAGGPSFRCPFGMYNGFGSNGGIAIFDRHQFGSSGGTKFDVALNGTFPAPSGTTSVSVGTLYRVMFSRSGTTCRLFVNGSLEGTATSSATIQQVGGLWIGANGDGTSISNVSGLIGRVRVTKGVARAVASYTPTSRPYPTY